MPPRPATPTLTYLYLIIGGTLQITQVYPLLCSFQRLMVLKNRQHQNQRFRCCLYSLDVDISWPIAPLTFCFPRLRTLTLRVDTRHRQTGVMLFTQSVSASLQALGLSVPDSDEALRWTHALFASPHLSNVTHICLWIQASSRVSLPMQRRNLPPLLLCPRTQWVCVAVVDEDEQVREEHRLLVVRLVALAAATRGVIVRADVHQHPMPLRFSVGTADVSCDDVETADLLNRMVFAGGRRVGPSTTPSNNSFGTHSQCSAFTTR